jgi:2-iminobutanoate/2-iminopropanoate deaminase
VSGYNGKNMSEAKTAIQTSQAPAALGPYSQAIRIGNFVFTSGQVALDPASGQLVSGGIEAQTHRALQNLQAVLAAAGRDLSRVVKTTVFLKDMNHFAAMNAIYAEYFQTKDAPAPARSTVEVARLPKDALVEIEVIAC